MFEMATRGAALFFGVFTIVTLAGDLRFARANTNVWWLDFWPLPLFAARILLAAVSAALLTCAVWPSAPGRTARQVLLGLAAVAATVSACRFYAALAEGAIRTPVPLPLSIVVALVLVLILIRHNKAHQARPLAIGACALVAAAVFPLLQVCFFGLTDYRRRAEAIIVFGARANRDGTASDALADRVRTASELYRAGLAPRVFMSGGPGEGAATEPQVMRALAERLGVPSAAILEDPHGINTEATVRNAARLLSASHQVARVIVVSHFYHLPRIKLAFQRRGIEAFTVPSHNTVPFTMPFNIAREDVAFWWYYARYLA